MATDGQLRARARANVAYADTVARTLPASRLRSELAALVDELRNQDRALGAGMATGGLGIAPVAIFGAGAAVAALPAVGAWAQRQWSAVQEFFAGSQEVAPRAECVSLAIAAGATVAEAEEVCTPARPTVPLWARGLVGGAIVFGALLLLTRRG